MSSTAKPAVAARGRRRRTTVDGGLPSTRPTVVYLGGLGRSGSTLISRVLDRVPGFVSVGEMSNLWNQGVLAGRPCGCGQPFHDCPFWTDVGRVAFGGWATLDPVEVNALRRRVERVRRVPLMVRPGLSPTYAHDLARYREITGTVYRAVHQVSGARYLVDNSKKPSQALVLRGLDDLDLHVLHLVRSPHGVAYSWDKKVTRVDLTGSGELQQMLRLTVRDSAARWMGINAMFELLAAAGTRTTRLRYEDFVGSPASTLRYLVDEIGARVDDAALDFVGDGTVDLSWDHSVWGNPMRMRTGPEPIRLDEQWRTALPAADRRLVTAVCAPGMKRYGYPLRASTTSVTSG